MLPNLNYYKGLDLIERIPNELWTEVRDIVQETGIKTMNAEFQRIARTDKKAFLSDQCKEIEERIDWETLEISSRKSEIPREHFMQRWSSIKDRNGRDLTEAEDIKKRWQGYTEELYKKDLHYQVIMMI